jgi:predicted Zn-dependent protease
MALEYQAHGESTRAEHWCRRAIALEPQSLDPYRLLVSVYRAGDQLANALLAQRRLMDLEPANVINRVNFASLAVALGRLDEGEEALDKAARMAPQNGLVRRMLAAVYIQRQELDKARAAAEQAVEVEPSPDSYRLLAEVCRLQGDLPAAEAAARAAEKRGASDEP